MNLSNKIIKVEKPKNGNRYAIGDIHGCFLTFQSLVEEHLKVSKQDQLFLLGDYVDRGPRSKQVLDYIINLKKDGYQIFPLRGNHEQDLLETNNYYNPRLYKFFVELMNKNKGLLDEDNRLKQEYRSFMENLPYLYVLDNFYLVHAGIDLTIEGAFIDVETMIRIRHPEYNEENLKRLNGKRIVHGHTVKKLDFIKEKIRKKEAVISLDNGCVYTKRNQIEGYENYGRLCGLNLETFELFIQKNIDQEKK